MKKVKESVGIDVSKKTIDAFLYNQGLHCQFTNNSPDAVRDLQSRTA